MTPNDFFYTQIYKGALSEGVPEKVAHAHAVIGLDLYKKSAYETPTKLLESCIKNAKRESKGRLSGNN